MSDVVTGSKESNDGEVLESACPKELVTKRKLAPLSKAAIHLIFLLSTPETYPS